MLRKKNAWQALYWGHAFAGQVCSTKRALLIAAHALAVREERGSRNLLLPNLYQPSANYSSARFLEQESCAGRRKSSSTWNCSWYATTWPRRGGEHSIPSLSARAAQLLQPSFVRTHMGGGHDHDHLHVHGAKTRNPNELKALEAGERISRVGLAADVVLTVAKGTAGYLSGSMAIIADAAHSVSDIVLSAFTLWSVRAASAPPDVEHPYGHGKLETLGAFGMSAFLILTGCGIGWHAFDVLVPLLGQSDSAVLHSLGDFLHGVGGHSHGHAVGAPDSSGHHQHHGIDHGHLGLALAVVGSSIAVKETLYWVTKAVGDRNKSALLQASAWHHRSDAVASVVALLGLGGTLAGAPWLDPMAGLVVSGMIVRAGVHTGVRSVRELADAGVPEAVLAPIRATVMGVPGVMGCHKLRGRRMGSRLHIDLHVQVNPWLSVSAGHNIAEAAAQALQHAHPEVTEVLVHVDPADGRPESLTPFEEENKGQLEMERTHDGGRHAHPHLPHHHLSQEHSSKDAMGSGGRSSTSSSSGSHRTEPTPEPLSTPSEIKTMSQEELEAQVREVLASRFSMSVDVRRLTSHFLQQGVVVEVEVALSSDLVISDARRFASDIEQEILQRIPEVSRAIILLELAATS